MNFIYFNELSKNNQIAILKWILVNEDPICTYVNNWIYHKGWKERNGQKINFVHKFKVHQDHENNITIKEAYRSNFEQFIKPIKPPNCYPHYAIANFPFTDLFRIPPAYDYLRYFPAPYDHDDIIQISRFINQSVHEYVVKFGHHKELTQAYELNLVHIQHVILDLRILIPDLLSIVMQYLIY